jgi:microcystin-dependent protein
MDPILGEIRIFAGSFAPVNWNFCDGSLLNLSEYEVLFTLINTTYGGNGTTNFAVPDLRGRLPIGQRSGPGLTTRPLGLNGGTEAVTLTTAEIPAHSHLVKASMATTASVTNPSDSTYLGPVVVPGETGYGYVSNVAGAVNNVLDNSVIQPFVGGGQAHDNMMPSMAINFIICTAGSWPDSNY